MEGKPKLRMTVLCEDRLQERFARGLCQRYGYNRVNFKVSPSGKGDAKKWVIANAPAFVAERRRKNRQLHLGLLILVDGDGDGCEASRREFEAKITEQGMAGRGPDETVALFAPTWSIETWLAHLAQPAGGPPLTEDRSLKEDSQLRRMWDEPEVTTATLKAAVNAWRRPGVGPRSLTHAYDEAVRIGL